MKRVKPLKIWRVFGHDMEWYAILAGDSPMRVRAYPEIGTVSARSEAEAISKVFHRKMMSDTDERFAE